ncbi:hypothetical protein [uncultured Tateyamaria sp.]|uniref:DUF6931 family protein n=1 Tax=uncultured Tateyamaria sp. TaxID=455651 RepID=UPI00260EC54A|nr:hypothetical protein [uncultured Tateyamaria sp.]
MSHPSPAGLSFDDLHKLPPGPAARVLTKHSVTLQTELDAPASASASEVLAELHNKSALLDMLQILAHTLPPREATWWSCLAAREMGAQTSAVGAAEQWVRQPGFDTRLAAREALDAAKQDDDTVFCAMAACFADGTMGPGEFDDHAAPNGAVGAAVYSMLLIALYADEATVAERSALFLERGLNIARGGNGKIEPNSDKAALTKGTASTSGAGTAANPNEV